jgi:hypothetical protein
MSTSHAAARQSGERMIVLAWLQRTIPKNRLKRASARRIDQGALWFTRPQKPDGAKPFCYAKPNTFGDQMVAVRLEKSALGSKADVDSPARIPA